MEKTFSNELLTKRELSELLKISTRSIDRKIAEREFPQGIKLGAGKGGAIRWPRSVVEKWIAERIAG